MNEIPLNYTVADSGEIFYVCVEFPSTSDPGFPNGFPFLRMDYSDLERGLFGNSYNVLPNGAAALSYDRNFIISLVCRVDDTGRVPIASTTNLGANRLISSTQFTFRRPPDLTADGVAIRRNSLSQTLLLFRSTFGPWTVADSAGPGRSSISVGTLPPSAVFWSTQAIDKNGNRAIPSSGLYTRSLSNLLGDGLLYDYDEPNGALDCARPIVSEHRTRAASCEPAGDQDYYSFAAMPGDTIDVIAAGTKNGKNDLDLVITLYDGRGRIVSYDDNSNGGLIDPRLTYVVPWRSAGHRDHAPRQYSILIRERHGSFLDPDAPPRTAGFGKGWYNWSFVIYPGRRDLTDRAPEALADLAPFLRATTQGDRSINIRYVLPTSAAGAQTSIRIYDVRGRLIRTLIREIEAAGSHAVRWDGRGRAGERLAPGVYFAELESTGTRATAKVLVTP